MARLKMQSEGWFCPTAEELLPLIVARVDMQQPKPYILDPSCGDGRVADYLAKTWGGFSYGNEINDDRYQLAKTLLFACTHGPQESLQVKGFFDVIYVNPPYDYSEDAEGERIELLHARQAAHWLRPRGLLVALIPEHLAHKERFWKWWTGWFDSTQIYRTPPDVYERDGKQVVLFGLKKYSVSHYGNEFEGKRQVERIEQEGIEHLTPCASEPRVTVAAQTWDRKTPRAFRNALPKGEQILLTLQGHNPLDTSEFQNLTLPPRSQTHFRPVIPPRPGHLAQLIAVGVLNGERVYLDDEPFIILGASEKYKDAATEELEDGGSRTVETERSAWQIHLLSEVTGQYRMVDSRTPEYATFLAENLEFLLRAAQVSAPPLYDGDYDRLIPYFNRIHSPRDLPGRSGNGLLTAQKHVVAGLHELLKTSHSAVLVGEMGTGKTCTSIALAMVQALEAGIEKPRVVVMAPAVVAPKWVEEVEAVLREFKAKGFLIGQERKQAHYVPQRMTLTEALRHLEAVEKDVLDGKYVSSHRHRRVKVGKPILDIQRAWAYDGPALIVLTYNKAKDGSKWEHAPTTRKVHERVKVDDGTGSYPPRFVKVTRTNEAFSCPDCGHIFRDEDGGYWSVHEQFRAKGNGRKQQQCPACGCKLFQYIPYKRGGKWPAAFHIAQHHTGEYFLIVDELHNSAGADTDIGRAMAALAFNSWKNLGMTGTIFNGYAKSLFHLLYRLDHEFRQMYKHTECKLFEAHHGLTKTITTRRNLRSTGAYGYDRWEETTHERPAPGATPAMAAMLLKQAVFLSLAEIGVELPPYDEYALPVEVDGGDEDFDDLEMGLKELRQMRQAAAKKMILSGGKAMGAFSKYMWAALGWIDCPEGETIVIGDEEDGERFHLPRCPEPAGGFPKDRKVVDLVIDRLNRGRGVAVFFEQVNRRPAWPRIKRLLEGRGVEPFVLTASVSAEERMPRIHKYVKSVEANHPPVLLANGALVKEGVDLLDFPTIVEFGQNYQVNLVRQRDRRSWRLGQEKDVEVIFAYYEGSGQQAALYHIAAKLQAAHQIDGQVSNGIASQFTEASFMQDLMARAEGAELPSVSEFLQTVSVADNVQLQSAHQQPEPEPAPVEKPVETPKPTDGLPAQGSLLSKNMPTIEIKFQKVDVFKRGKKKVEGVQQFAFAF